MTPYFCVHKECSGCDHWLLRYPKRSKRAKLVSASSFAIFHLPRLALDLLRRYVFRNIVTFSFLLLLSISIFGLSLLFLRNILFRGDEILFSFLFLFSLFANPRHLFAFFLPSFFLPPFQKVLSALHLQVHFSGRLRGWDKRFVLVMDDVRFSSFRYRFFGKFGEEPIPGLIPKFRIFRKFSFNHEQGWDSCGSCRTSALGPIQPDNIRYKKHLKAGPIRQKSCGAQVQSET